MPYEKVGNNEPVCIADEVPFEIPESWGWVRLKELCSIVNGFTPLRTNMEYWDNPTIPWFTVDDIRAQGRRIKSTIQLINEKALAKNTSRILPSGTVLLCCTASVGEFAITEIPLTTNQQFNGLVIKDYWKKYFWNEFLFKISETFKDRLLSLAGKTTFNFISVKKLENLIIPLPPLEEQRRIVHKINELIYSVEIYGRLENEVRKLQIEFPEKLRKSILQEAVQGKFVPQDPNDEPASILLERIREEKQRLIKEGKIKKDKHESIIFRRDNSYYEKLDGIERCIDNEIPFVIPDSWQWIRLGNLLSVISDGTHKTPNYLDKGIPFLSVQNISHGYFDFTKLKYISDEEHKKLIERVKPKINDILFCRIGTLGKAIKNTLDFEFSIFVSIGLLRPVISDIADYIILCINSPFGDKWIQENKVGGGTHTFKINLVDIPNMLIPLPPLSEQKRIAQQIEIVFSLLKTL